MSILNTIWDVICPAQKKLYERNLAYLKLSKEYTELVDEYNNLNVMFDKDKAELASELVALQTLLLESYDEIKELEAEISEFNYGSSMPTALAETLQNYEEKYQKATVSYKGRYWTKPDNTKVYFEQPVNTFIDPTDWRLTIPLVTLDKLMENNPKKSFHWICDELVWLCWFRWKPNYTAENTAWGVTERWNTLQESLAGAPMDCEDHAHRLASALLASGLPEEMLRVVCGDTKQGGHSTVYYYASDGKWHHLEATGHPKKPLDAPINGDLNDQLGITSVWFAFNKSNMWHEFTTDASENSFGKLPGNELISFVPLR